MGCSLQGSGETLPLEPEFNYLFGDHSIYVPALIYSHELWVVTERIRSQEEAEMRVLHWAAVFNVWDRVRSS